MTAETPYGHLVPLAPPPSAQELRCGRRVGQHRPLRLGHRLRCRRRILLDEADGFAGPVASDVQAVGQCVETPDAVAVEAADAPRLPGVDEHLEAAVAPG